jgi:hypothetical protein
VFRIVDKVGGRLAGIISGGKSVTGAADEKPQDPLR